MENRLTVFWIEDNPIQSNVERINGKQYPKFLHEELFNYCLFQHPKQVEEYLSMISVLKSKSHELAEICEIALPDIIAFDYKMADAFKNNQHALSYYDEDHRRYLISKSACHKLKQKFEKQLKSQPLFLDREDVNGLEYGGDEFIKEIKATELQLDDEFGLYCGITIVREFKEYITVGVPATINKADKAGTMSYNSLFFEWLNSYDLKGAIDRPADANEMKEWTKILSFSVRLLRERIVAQIQTGKATPDYSQLNSLAEGNIPGDRIFSFETIYGKRDLPLDGLFIDITDKGEQKNRIKQWAEEILKKLPVDNTIIKKADVTVQTLWETYRDSFEDRIVLSDYSRRKDILNDAEQKRLKEAREKLGVKSDDKIEQECSIKTLLDKLKENKTNIIRLTFLMLIAGADIKLNKQRRESKFNSKYYELTEEEYVNLLFPKVNFKNPLLLTMNIEKDKSGHIEAQTTWLVNNLKSGESKVTLKTLFQIDEWILKGEKEVLRSFYYPDSKYFPQWLKS